MNLCWTGDGNDAEFYSPYEPRLSGEGWETKFRCGECVNLIGSTAATGLNDERLTEILGLKVPRKGAKLKTQIDRLMEDWAAKDRANSTGIPPAPKQEMEW